MNPGPEGEPKAQTPPEFRPPEQPEPPAIPDHQLLRRIGRGSYGEVWLARSVTGAYRAVKIVYRRDFDHERPFEREFSGILKFEPVSRKHDSQMDILHVGRGDDWFFYVMELADDQFTGQQINPDSYAPKSLKSELLHRAKLPFDECVQISLSLTTALENLHNEGLVHRDIKPSNVIYVNGVVKLADIGLVTSVDASRSFVGTEGFVAPEGPGTPQADLYSLGKVLYELCTGKDRQDFPELPTNLDGWPDREGLLELNVVIAKACREDPRQRYPSAQAMHSELLLLQSGKSLARLHAAQRTLAKLQRTAVAAGAAVLVLAAALSLATIGWRQTRLERDKALQARAREEIQRKAAHVAQIVADVQAQHATESQQQTRRLLYDSDMYLAQEELKMNNLDLVRRLLDRHRPQPGEEDLRGWEWRYLWQLSRSTSLVTLTNRPEAGCSVSFSPDGSHLAVGWQDGRVELWDVPGRQCVRILTERLYNGALPERGAGHVAFSPVRNLLAATSKTNAVSLYDLDSGRETILWRAGSEWEVRGVEFSQDGSRVVIHASSCIVTATYGNTVTSTSTEKVCVVNVSSAEIESSRFTDWSAFQEWKRAQLSPDNRRLYLAHSVHTGYSIKCFDLATESELWETEPQPGQVLSAMAISPDGRILASGSGTQDPTIHVWDAATGRLLLQLEGHAKWVCKLAFSRDGRCLISAAADQSIRLWDTGTWTEAEVLLGHRDEVHDVAISEKGDLVASTSKDGDLMLWKEEGKEAKDGYLLLPENVRMVWPLDHSRAVLIYYDKDKPAELFDLSRGASLGSLPGLGLSANFLNFNSNWVCRWDGTHQLLVEEWSGSQFARLGAVPWDIETRPNRVIFNPARQLVAWNEPYPPNSLFLASLATPERRIVFKGLSALGFRDDGKYLVAAEGATLRVWNVDTGQSVVTLSEPSRDVAFAVGGGVFVASVVSDNGHEIRFYDLDHPDRAPQRVPGRGEPHALAVSPDGRLVAVTTESGTVRLCNAVTGQLIQDLLGHLNAAIGVAFSKDGRRLISTGGGCVKLWDVGTGRELLKFLGKVQTPGSGSYVADGQGLGRANWIADGDTILAGRPWQAWRAPSWEEIAAAEAKNPPSPGYGGQGNAEAQPP
jgi:WD40 repeat protein